MKFKLSIWLVAATVLTHTASAAEQPAALVLDQVVEVVLGSNPALKAAAAKWEAATARIPQARAWADPRLGFDQRAARFVGVPPNSFSDEKLMLEQTLPISGKNRLRGDAAMAEAGRVLAESRRQQLDAVMKAKAAYFRLAGAYKQMDLNRKNSALLKRFAGISRAKLATDERSQADVLSADTESAKIDESRVDFEREISEAQIELNILMNRAPESPLAPPAEFTFPPFNFSLANLEGLALANRPELFMAQRNLEAAQARLKAARKEWVPEPSFRIEADRYNGAAQAVSELDAGFSLDLPWFNRSKYRAGIQENERLVEAAQHELEAARSEALGLVASQFRTVEAYHHHTELYQGKLLPLAQESAHSRRVGYESNKDTFLEILSAEQTVREVESMYWDHLAHYQIGLAELESIIGVKLAPPDDAVKAHPH